MAKPFADPAIDLTSCDREPIEIPGAVQPHGMLFALAGPDLSVHAVSANATAHVARDAASLLGRPFAELVDDASLARVRSAIENPGEDTEDVALHSATGHAWRALVHATAGGGMVEVSLASSPPAFDTANLFFRYEKAVRRLRAATSPAEACDLLTEEVRALTGYDRVKLYRFAADWTGEVIAETRAGHMPSFKGLHFPAGDIPVQARQLYRLNLERQIPDVGYRPVPLIQATPASIDLSPATLRSVSPLHIEYLTNMGVGASFSVSILRHGELWGLIACHHATPHDVPPELRKACVMLGHLVSWQLTYLEESETVQRSIGVKAVETALLHETTAGQDYREGLLRHSSELLSLLDASGLAISSGLSLVTIGETPPEDLVREIRDWLAKRGPETFKTDHLAQHLPAAVGQSCAAGLLAVPLGGLSGNMMVWFRPEILRSVTWGGDPDKPVETATGRLTPRLSFNAWTKSIHGHAKPWEPHEVAAANSLRDMVADIILRRSAELEDINAKLVRSNEELEAFAYVASHDLKEPLRQIETFSTLLERMFNNKAPTAADPRQWFQGIQSSSRRLRTLIDDLAEYSRLGRHGNAFASCNLDEIVEDAKADLGLQIEQTGAHISSDRLPVVLCDHTQMRQVVQNLLSNALKYRHAGRTPQIRITAAIEPPGLAARLPMLQLTIADNGIGFDERYSTRIFEPFQRLHSADDYEGSGIGLSICRKIIDRHGGSITASGTPGDGARFTIRLPMRPTPIEEAE